MDNFEYKSLKKKSGVIHQEQWCRLMQIAPDTDKSYSSGRLNISSGTSQKILEKITEMERRANILKKKLLDNLPTSSKLEFDSETLNINITLPSGIHLLVKNKGIDSNDWSVYVMFLQNRELITFLHATHPKWKPSTSGERYEWFIWRGAFRSGIQSYWNLIEKPLLEEVLNTIS